MSTIRDEGATEHSTCPQNVPAAMAPQTGASAAASDARHRVRAARLARGLSVDELAAKIGVDGDMLRRIEESECTPSLGLLWRIAAALGVAFAELLGRGGTAVTVLRRADAGVLRSEDGLMESRPLVTAGASRWVEAYELRLAPGGAHASEPHPSGTREIIVVLAGALRVRMDCGAHELTEGDSISFQADVPHVYENPGGQAGRYHDIIIYEH